MKILTKCIAFVSFISWWGCNSPTTIEVESERLLLTGKGESLQLKPIVKGKDGQPLHDVPVTFRSLSPTLANVDSNGNVSAVTSGTATILIEAGKIARQVDVLIQIPKKIKIDPEAPWLMLGVTKGFKATIYDDRNRPMIAGEIRWSSSDPKIFTVDKFGNVKTLEEGKALLIAHAAGIQGNTEITVKHEELHEDGTLSQ